MSDKIVFLGTKGAGKTTMVSIMRGETPPQEPVSTDGNTAQDCRPVIIEKRWWPWLDKTIMVHDTGGKNTNKEEDYKRWIEESAYVVFVFDGREFLKEMDSVKGGIIGTKIRNWILSVFEKNGRSKNNLIFVATHKDLYAGDMKRDILDKMKKVNEEYKELVHTKRYIFEELMEDDQNFFCIDSRDATQVNDIFNKLKEKIK